MSANRNLVVPSANEYTMNYFIKLAELDEKPALETLVKWKTPSSNEEYDIPLYQLLCREKQFLLYKECLNPKSSQYSLISLILLKLFYKESLASIRDGIHVAKKRYHLTAIDLTEDYLGFLLASACPEILRNIIDNNEEALASLDGCEKRIQQIHHVYSEELVYELLFPFVNNEKQNSVISIDSHVRLLRYLQKLKTLQDGVVSYGKSTEILVGPNRILYTEFMQEKCIVEAVNRVDEYNDKLAKKIKQLLDAHDISNVSINYYSANLKFDVDLKINLLYELIFHPSLPADKKNKLLQNLYNGAYDYKHRFFYQTTKEHVLAAQGQLPKEKWSDVKDASGCTPFLYALAQGYVKEEIDVADIFTNNYPVSINWPVNIFKNKEKEPRKLIDLRRYFKEENNFNLDLLIHLYRRNKEIMKTMIADKDEAEFNNIPVSRALIDRLAARFKFDFIVELFTDFPGQQLTGATQEEFSEALYTYFFNAKRYDILKKILPYCPQSLENVLAHQVLDSIVKNESDDEVIFEIETLYVMDKKNPRLDLRKWQLNQLLARNYPIALMKVYVKNSDLSTGSLLSLPENDILSEELIYRLFSRNNDEQEFGFFTALLSSLIKYYPHKTIDLNKLVGFLPFTTLKAFFEKSPHLDDIKKRILRHNYQQSKSHAEIEARDNSKESKLILDGDFQHYSKTHSLVRYKPTTKTVKPKSDNKVVAGKPEKSVKINREQSKPANPPVEKVVISDEEAIRNRLNDLKGIGIEPIVINGNNCTIKFTCEDKKSELIKRFKEFLTSQKIKANGPKPIQKDLEKYLELELPLITKLSVAVESFVKNKKFENGWYGFINLEKERQKPSDNKNEEKQFTLNEDEKNALLSKIQATFDCLKGVKIIWVGDQIEVHLPLKDSSNTVDINPPKSRHDDSVVGELTLNARHKIIANCFNDKRVPGLAGIFKPGDNRVIVISINKKIQTTTIERVNDLGSYIYEAIESKRMLPTIKPVQPSENKKTKEGKEEENEIHLTKENIATAFYNITKLSPDVFINPHGFEFLNPVEKEGERSQLELTYKHYTRLTIGQFDTRQFFQTIKKVFNTYVPGLIEFYPVTVNDDKSSVLIISDNKFKDEKNPFKTLLMDKNQSELAKEVATTVATELMAKKEVKELEASGLFSLRKNKVKQAKAELAILVDIRQSKNRFSDEIEQQVLYAVLRNLHAFQLMQYLNKGKGNESKLFNDMRNIFRHSYHDAIKIDSDKFFDQLFLKTEAVLAHPKNPPASLFVSDWQFFAMDEEIQILLNEEIAYYGTEVVERKLGENSLDISALFEQLLGRLDEFKKKINLEPWMWRDIEIGLHNFLGEMDAKNQRYHTVSYKIYAELHFAKASGWDEWANEMHKKLHPQVEVQQRLDN